MVIQKLFNSENLEIGLKKSDKHLNGFAGGNHHKSVEPLLIIPNKEREKEGEEAKRSDSGSSNPRAKISGTRDLKDKGRHYQLALRIVCFLGIFVDVVWFCYITLFFALTLVIAALTLFTSKPLRKAVAMYWRYLRLSIVVAIGLVIGLFSPRIGVSIIFGYLFLNLEGFGNARTANFLHTNFRDISQRL